MTNAEPATEKAIFQAAFVISDVTKRDKYLTTACQDNPPLRLRIESLLKAAEGNGSFMRKKAVHSLAADPGNEISEGLATSLAHETGTIVCPRCQDSIELPQDEIPAQLTCPTCGSNFQLDSHSTAHWSPSEIQRKLGCYELIKLVGSGAFGAVHKARDPELDRVVAIKIPRVTQLAGEGDLERFMREARSVAKLQHPSIVPIYEVGEAAGLPYLVSEFVEGITLADLLSAKRPPPREAAALVASVADVLQYAHEMGVVHRDIKPANIMLDQKGQPRLMDFGLAKRETGDVTMTIDGQILGTPAYMSPEQAKGEAHQADGRTDVYSLGVILYQLLTGELPFRGTTRMLLHQVLHDEPRRPRSLADHVPRDLETICLRAMCKEPSGRYATARNMADDLRRFLNGEPIHARPSGRAERLWRWSRRNPAVATLTAAVAALLVAVAVGGAVAATQFRARAEQEEALRSDVEERLYFHSIALAHREILADNLGEAQKLLAACPPRLRDWEWRYLQRLSAVDPTVIEGPQKPIFSLAFSPDGKHIAAAQEDGRIGIFEIQTGERFFLEGHEKHVFSLAFHPQGKYLASAGADRKVKLWNLQTRESVYTKSGHNGMFAGTAYAIAFSPDGQCLAAPSDEQTMTIWSVPDGRAVQVLGDHSRLVGSVAYSPDGGLVATGNFGNLVTLWDARTGTLLRTLAGHTAAVAAVAFSPDGRHLASASYDRLAKVWDVSTGKEVSTLTGHPGLVVGVAFTSDGKRLATMGGEDRAIKLWDPISGQDILTLKGHTNFCQCVTISRDGSQIASSGMDGTIRLWDARKLDRDTGLWSLQMRHDHEVWSVVFSPDGRQIASASWDTTARLWDAASGRLLHTFRLPGTGFCIRFSPAADRRLAATIGSMRPINSILAVWETTAFAPAFPAVQHKGNPFCVEFSPDGKYLLKGGQDQTGNHFVQVFDAQAGREVGAFANHHQDIWAIKFCPDGRRVATASNDKTIKLWEWNPQELSTAAKLWQIELPISGLIDRIAFSPNGLWLLTGGEANTVRIWDATNGAPLHALAGHTGNVNAVAFSPDGKVFASGGEDTTVRLWDATQNPPAPRYKLRGHTGLINTLAFSADSQRLVSGSRDKTIKVWDLARFIGDE